VDEDFLISFSPLLKFKVRTKDGYILSMQRIPEGRNGDKNGGEKQPVLLQHGILMVIKLTCSS
jgi:Partial alpha/beta-hydrolase lipase region